MSRLKRLEQLETDTLTAWRQAWERSAVVFDRHVGEILIDPPDLQRRLEAALPGLSSDDVEAEGVAFLEGLGVTQYRAFEAWFKSYKLPEDDPPDLTSWPEMIPTPPDEPPGDWRRVAPYTTSENVVKQLAAQLYCSCWRRLGHSGNIKQSTSDTIEPDVGSGYLNRSRSRKLSLDLVVIRVGAEPLEHIARPFRHHRQLVILPCKSFNGVERGKPCDRYELALLRAVAPHELNALVSP
jgi:hypothetical protein